jgi:hypothetical protein
MVSRSTNQVLDSVLQRLCILQSSRIRCDRDGSLVGVRTVSIYPIASLGNDGHIMDATDVFFFQTAFLYIQIATVGTMIGDLFPRRLMCSIGEVHWICFVYISAYGSRVGESNYDTVEKLKVAFTENRVIKPGSIQVDIMTASSGLQRQQFFMAVDLGIKELCGKLS